MGEGAGIRGSEERWKKDREVVIGLGRRRQELAINEEAR